MGWRIAYWCLLVASVLSAVLNLLHVRGGFLTNHLADVTLPALLYVLARELVPGRSLYPRWLTRVLGRTPERAALFLFIASSATELDLRYVTVSTGSNIRRRRVRRDHMAGSRRRADGRPA